MKIRRVYTSMSKNHIGSEGVFSDFDESLWSKSTIYILSVPLGPKVDATVKNHDLNKASAGRRRPRRPGFSNSLLQSWESWFLSEIFAH